MGDGLINRMLRALRLDSTLYREVAAPDGDTRQAALVVLLTAPRGPALRESGMAPSASDSLPLRRWLPGRSGPRGSGSLARDLGRRMARRRGSGESLALSRSHRRPVCSSRSAPSSF